MCHYQTILFAILSVTSTVTALEDTILRGPPLVDTNINLLDSYVPASMQVIAHITDLMKYDLRPPAAASVTSTTLRPTKPHNPGIYAPEQPLGASYLSKSSSFEEYVHILQNSDGYNYFDKYTIAPAENINSREQNKTNREFLENIPENVGSFVGEDLRKLLDLVNCVENDFSGTQEEQVREFSLKYDDDEIRPELRQKRVPPTKAYVTLLSLYDLLNKEAKKLMLNKYQGYSDEVLQKLAGTSTGTSANQLKFVLQGVVEKRNIKQENVLKRIKTIVTDLEEDNSYINSALEYIMPLQFNI